MSATAARALLTRARTQIERPRDLLLIVRMLCWGVALRVLKHSVALPTLVRLARWKRQVDPHDTRVHSQQEKIVTLARWACRPMPWSDRGSCLERSLVTYRYLTAVSANPTLVIGMAPRSETFDLVHGHVWVVVDGQPVGESEASLSDFHAVMKFDASGQGL
jgi:transglutaminase superfamily protein